jgi:hypothetical protein
VVVVVALVEAIVVAVALVAVVEAEVFSILRSFSQFVFSIH